MSKQSYECTVLIDASFGCQVTASTPEEAAEIAQDKAAEAGAGSLCHQCSSSTQMGDQYAVVVYDEAGTEILDTDWRSERIAKLESENDQLKAKLAELEAIGALINSQDNRCTDQPMFAVMERRGIPTLDTHDHDRIDWVETESGDYCEADETKARRLEALHQGHRDTPGWERYAMKDVDVFVTACFTEQGCKDFLARDGHNHRKPFIYAFGSYRNSEYQSVRNWLKSLPKKNG